MKKNIEPLLLVCIVANFSSLSFSQNVGIGITTPEGKLHIKGTANASQFIIDAKNTQTNTNPLIKLRKSDGTDLMWIHSDAEENVFIGVNAGSANNAAGGGVGNIFIGDLTGYLNTTGLANTGIGHNVLLYNTVGTANTAVGYGALYINTTAGENTAIGTRALFSQTYNPGIAWESANTAVGCQALYLNNPTSNANGIYNTAVGHSALYANKTGVGNTGIGYVALRFNNTGTDNTAIGKSALYTNTTGHNNSAVGVKALFNNTDGGLNTAMGTNALLTNTLGKYNTAVGAGSDVSANNLENATAIGYGATVNTSNKMQLGNTITGSISTFGGYTIASDGRFKENLQADVKGLDFIMKLRPYTYNFSYSRFDEFIQPVVLVSAGEPGTEKESSIHQQQRAEEKAKYKLQLASRDAKRETGFVAQEVEQAVKETGYTAFNGVYAPTNIKDNYALDYSKMVVPLVKAVQEQQAIIEGQNKKIELLEKRLAAIEKNQIALK